jgi:hypothetical protein
LRFFRDVCVKKTMKNARATDITDCHQKQPSSPLSNT